MTKPKSLSSPMLSVIDVAVRLRVCTKTVRRWIERSELRVHRIGHQLRVSEEDMAMFIGKSRR